MSVRLSGTEKQRDDALEALVLQQEIAEELERERKRNKKELAALQHTNVTIARQRDEARRVVLHLRSLIGGQSHHMEHLVQSLTDPVELEEEIANGFVEATEEDVNIAPAGEPHLHVNAPHDETNRIAPVDKERLVKAVRNSKRFSTSSFFDVADRHLKDKTDAIAHIIRNIAEQCQAAVEGLQLAQDAEIDGQISHSSRHGSRRGSGMSMMHSDDGHSAATSDVGEESHLTASGRASSIPPTPDLIPNRSSTSMSIASTTMTTPERSSQQYSMGHGHEVTKIVEEDDDDYNERSESEAAMRAHNDIVGKHAESLMHRPSGARISALGGPR